MVLRTGIILPFQFRDTKKLLMVGSPEENRDLNLFDLKNAVRTAFGIEDFVFRNKKIDFTIPEEMVLNYLAQRHDLTNFVIEVRLASLPSPQPPQHQQQSTTQHQQQSTPQQHPLYSPSLCHRRRGERMSKDQKEIYVKYLEDNPCILSQRRNDNSIEPYWIKLAALLNSVTQGAVKTVEEWKQTFDAWRYRVFMYTRFNARLSAEGNQHPKNYKPLTATDQRAYAMWTSHKHSAPGDYDKIDMFGNLDDTQNTFDY